MATVGKFTPPRGSSSQGNLLKKMEKLHPKRHAVFTAIEELSTREEIRQFYEEYINYLKTEAREPQVRREAERVARENIGYILGYYDKNTADKWMKTLPEVYHPIFGRDIFTVKPEDAFIRGQKYGEKLRRSR
jgi:hypothetical protein